MKILNLKHNSFAVISNIFFVVPFVLTVIRSDLTYSLLIFLVIISSVLYHAKNKLEYLILDSVMAVILIIRNIYSFYTSVFLSAYFITALVFVFIGFWFYYKSNKEKGGLNHSLWHLSSSIITLMAVLAAI